MKDFGFFVKMVADMEVYHGGRRGGRHGGFRGGRHVGGQVGRHGGGQSDSEVRGRGSGGSGRAA